MYYEQGGAEQQVRKPGVLRSASRHIGAGILGVPSSQAFGDGEAARVWVLAAMWVAAAALGILAASLPQPRQVDRLGELFIALAGGATGIGLWSRISRVPSWAVHVLLAGGVVCVSAAVYLAHGGNQAVAGGYMYLWIVSYAGYFFRPRVAAVHFAFVAAAFLCIVALGGVGRQPGPVAVMVLGTAAGSGVVLNRLAKFLREAAVTDQLTGLSNRNALPRIFEREVAHMKRTGGRLSAALVDLDGLKSVNDTAGHQAGDRLIADAARRWQSALRDVDSLLRHGGDEFVLLMPSCGIEDALAVCERMRVAGEAPCSIGVTEWAPGEELDALLGRADRALYEAKRAGRGRIVLQDRLQAS